MLAEAHETPERTVVLPLLHGPMGEDGTVLASESFRVGVEAP